MKKDGASAAGALALTEGEERTQSGRAYQAIRHKILHTELEPGQVINEKMLMAELGFGRTPIREALLRLSAERLVLFQASQVIQVAPVDFQTLSDLYEDRLHSERLAARLCAQRMDDDLARRIETCFDEVPRLVEEGKASEIIGLDFKFHSLIYNGSGNSFLIHHLRNLFGHSYRILYMTRISDDDIEEHLGVVRSHEPLVAALMNKDMERVDEEISEHIVNSYNRASEALTRVDLEDEASMRLRTLDTGSDRK
ncbi:MAG TPA: GntR family transcriptional regulator [Arenicellales bacterium]|nr:GntR family transcriptional regulator [Arenicellales bacterium]